MILDEDFWDNRYKTSDIGWDLGEVSPPLKSYFNQLTNKYLHILIPGGGNSYEAEYLHSKGFKNVYVVDLSKTALQNIKSRVPTFPSSHLIHSNFFDLNITFDLIIEQTFFCAISPSLRSKYVEKAFNLLNTNGKIAGLLFNIPLNSTHPPFGGNKEEYIMLFKPHFNIKIMDTAYNSIKPRSGNELFIILQKK
ncbi:MULTISPECIES: methyltransferase domain-containing protein [unclassified Cellulophaga]|uniref:methyltransferase domain-containing protein n=1 Tax=unclassified Cellulophaga TaxID=2634405 RepID=UPI0026E22FE0|nr:MULTISPECIES: methyltransferase domain-containing protein [unclassified Cellulophaga]MDO6490891.1 methyltransferase domain-containing protein [Cellulophaga sp. 2_MG-2023]MDO6493915.1 methyltransferase domain-containing protein [Cellulophaga sp. 3_MG-2023]